MSKLYKHADHKNIACTVLYGKIIPPLLGFGQLYVDKELTQRYTPAFQDIAMQTPVMIRYTDPTSGLEISAYVLGSTISLEGQSSFRTAMPRANGGVTSIEWTTPIPK